MGEATATVSLTEDEARALLFATTFGYPDEWDETLEKAKAKLRKARDSLHSRPTAADSSQPNPAEGPLTQSRSGVSDG